VHDGGIDFSSDERLAPHAAGADGHYHGKAELELNNIMKH
jgi:hypothetical protein